ncbi:hypothetical protein [uncultured Sphingomonas sp.]|uniref:spike base protein, RCAP_Rcc01079 family n=1 Tax=uncultured Sphingomonas sp. TaxID=158754 RepID=UPI0025F7DFE4|nr:hypothetical protein [uncultured Sphingomonas sp.]
MKMTIEERAAAAEVASQPFGQVVDNPNPLTMLGRLKALLDAILPARTATAVVPSDTIALNPIPRGIYIGSGGDVTIRPAGSGADVTYKNMTDCSYIAVRISHVRATGTTATNMIAEA